MKIVFARIVALTLSLAAAPAWAQGQGKIMEAVGPQLDAYTLCLKQKARDLAKSPVSQDTIIEEAIAACHAERKDLWAHLQVPPLNASPDDANEAVKELSAAMLPAMINAIEAARAN